MISIRRSVVALLVAMMFLLPAAALATSLGDSTTLPGPGYTLLNVKPSYTVEVTGVYENEAEAYVASGLMQNCIMANEELNYFFANAAALNLTPFAEMDYSWQLNAELTVDEEHRFVNTAWQPESPLFDVYRYFFMSEEGKDMIGMDVFSCRISDPNSSFETELVFKLTGFVSEPYFEMGETHRYFTAGETLTFECPQPKYYGEPADNKLKYQLCRQTVDDEGWIVREAVSEATYGPTVSIAATAEMDGEVLEWAIVDENTNRNYYCDLLYYLYDKANTPIIIPDHQAGEKHVWITKDTPFTAELPAASGDGGKIVYNWLCYGYDAQGEFYEYMIPTEGPSLTLTLDNARKNASYILFASYEDDEDKLAMDYRLIVRTHLVLDADLDVDNVETDTAFKQEDAAALGADNYTELLDKKMTPVFMSTLDSTVNKDEVLDKVTVYPMMATLKDQDGNDITKEVFDVYSALKTKLPMPEGCSWATHTFTVIHTFTQTANGHQAGETEVCECINEGDGMLTFVVTGLSPIALYTVDERSEGAVSPIPPSSMQVADVPRTGDATPLTALTVLMLLAAGGCLTLRRKHS